jgi:hypothetical protein
MRRRTSGSSAAAGCAANVSHPVQRSEPARIKMSVCWHLRWETPVQRKFTNANETKLKDAMNQPPFDFAEML